MVMEVYLEYLSHVVKIYKILIYELCIRLLRFPEKNVENPLPKCVLFIFEPLYDFMEIL